MQEIKSKTIIKVPFYDLDPMNIVWHGNYVKYLEMARCDFFAKLNYTYEDMYKDGVIYPIAKMNFKFIKSAKFEEELTIECSLKEIEPALVIKYTISADSEKILTAETMQICVDVKTGESLYQAPQRLVKEIERFKYEN